MTGEPCNIVVSDNGTTHQCVMCLVSNEGSRPECPLKSEPVREALAQQAGAPSPAPALASEVSPSPADPQAGADGPAEGRDWPTHQLASDGDNVVPLRGRPAGQGDEVWRGHRDTTPNPDIIVMCETLLAKAKSGEIRGIAFATTRIHQPEPELGISTGWWNSANAERWALHGAVAYLHHRMNRMADDSD